MILVDDQSGSRDLFPFIKAINPSTLLTRIDPPFGDVAWVGEGPDGGTTRCGVEYKQLNDVLDCMIDGRFAGHQLIGMINSYDRIYLLVEMGGTRWDRRTGFLQRWKPTGNGKGVWVDVMRAGRNFTYRDLEHWYSTFEEFAQLRVVRTGDQSESARWVTSKYSWWTSKGYDEHKSMCQFHVPPPPVAAFAKPGVVRRVAKELHDLGWERSGPVAAHFGTIYRMANAPAEEWAAIEVGVNKLGITHTVGKNRAIKIVNEIHGRGAFE